MYREYEIFEVLPNGASSRKAIVSGVEFAQLTLAELAKNTPNECYAAEVKSHRIVAHMNMPSAKWRVFQITYDETLGYAKAELLRQLGYEVVSAVGNEMAKQLLGYNQHYDLFIVGHSAPAETRKEMVRWLQQKFPNVRILALNSSQDPLPGADFNVKDTGAQNWLPIVTQR
jgi:CheY-like chemotaxis protein